jgi:hypothetical protein
MEQTAIDISAIRFGNFMLDRWLGDEEGFWKFLLNSFPCQICMITVYAALIKSGDIDKKTIDDLKHPKIIEATEQILKWYAVPDPYKFRRLLKAIISLSTLAEKRLEVTIGA